MPNGLTEQADIIDLKLVKSSHWRKPCSTGWWFQILIIYFHPYLGKIPILANIFQRGWNHQLVKLFWFAQYCQWHVAGWVLKVGCWGCWKLMERMGNSFWEMQKRLQLKLHRGSILQNTLQDKTCKNTMFFCASSLTSWWTRDLGSSCEFLAHLIHMLPPHYWHSRKLFAVSRHCLNTKTRRKKVQQVGWHVDVCVTSLVNMICLAVHCYPLGDEDSTYRIIVFLPMNRGSSFIVTRCGMFFYSSVFPRDESLATGIRKLFIGGRLIYIYTYLYRHLSYICE